MKNGPQTGSKAGGDALGFAEKLDLRLGQSTPEWLLELAIYSDMHGLKKTGKVINYSAPAISQVLSGTYRGDIARVAESVRGGLMGLTVSCPVMGTISRVACLREQKEPFRATSAMRAQLYHACRGGCTNFRNGGRNAE